MASAVSGNPRIYSQSAAVLYRTNVGYHTKTNLSECKCPVSTAQQGCVHWARVPAALQMFSVVSAQMTEKLHFLLSCLISSSSLLDSSSSHSPAEQGSVGERSRTEDDKETNCWTGQQKIPQKCLFVYTSAHDRRCHDNYSSLYPQLCLQRRRRCLDEHHLKKTLIRFSFFHFAESLKDVVLIKDAPLHWSMAFRESMHGRKNCFKHVIWYECNTKEQFLYFECCVWAVAQCGFDFVC